MKKIFLILIATLLSANFIQNKIYQCENMAISIYKDGKEKTIPNNQETKKIIKPLLKDLYSLSLTINNDNNITLKTASLKDNLYYLKDYKNLKVYAPEDKKIFLFLDNNLSIIAIGIPYSPQENIKIYYKCQ